MLPEVGARLHRIRAFGHDLLRSPDDLEVHRSDPFWWGGFIMAPWCNRIAAAPTPVGDRVLRVEPNFPDGSAIHGQVYARPWAVTGPGQLRVDGVDDGWPWAYTATFGIEIDGATARLDLRLTNWADVPMPAGIGLHPWFRRPLRAAIRGAEVYPDNRATTPRPAAVANRERWRCWTRAGRCGSGSSSAFGAFPALPRRRGARPHEFGRASRPAGRSPHRS